MPGPLRHSGHPVLVCGAARRRRMLRGFTLLELVIVIVIISVFAAITVPRVIETNSRYRIQSAASRVCDDLNLARRQARASSRPLTVTFVVADDYYRVEGVTNLDRPSVAYDIHLDLAPYEVQILSVDFDGDTEVTFDGFGHPDAGGTVVLGMRGFKTAVSLDGGTGRAVFLRAALENVGSMAPVRNK